MKVLKFGGTSVGTVESIKKVKQIVESLDMPAVVVVSALGGLTDKLISTSKKAVEGSDFVTDIEEIKHRHHNMVRNLLDEKDAFSLINQINPLLSELEDKINGIALIKSLPEETLNSILSFGERISSIIVANIINGAEHVDSLELIRTEKWFNKNIADTELTSELLKKRLAGKKLCVMGGFIATDRDSGEITNLGRGGSHYTAALVAAALDAEILEIWTDVDGFMTADPRIISDAYVLDSLSFVESMELCSFGAKVIYPPTIYPVFHKNIPIKILNTFNPEAPGTLISDNPENTEIPIVKGVSALKDTALLKVYGSGTGNIPEINSRTFNVLARNGIRIILVSQSESDESVSFALASSEVSKAIELLRHEFAPEISAGEITSINDKTDLSTIAIVGENIRSISGIESRINDCLITGNIIPLAYSSSASQTTISLIVDASCADNALSALHRCLISDQR